MCCPVGQDEGVYRFYSEVANWDEMGVKNCHTKEGMHGQLNKQLLHEFISVRKVHIQVLMRIEYFL